MVDAIAINGRPSVACAEVVFIIKQADDAFDFAPWSVTSSRSRTPMSSFLELCEAGYLTQLSPYLEVRAPQIGLYVDPAKLGLEVDEAFGECAGAGDGRVYRTTEDGARSQRRRWAEELSEKCKTALRNGLMAEVDRLARVGLEVAGETSKDLYMSFSLFLGAASLRGDSGGTLEQAWRFGGRLADRSMSLENFRSKVEELVSSSRKRLLGRLSSVSDLERSQAPLW